MQKHANKKESAVSPVVGVMLMLVVTIIIAGVVAVFAGGITGNSEQIPTAMISAEYSQTNGLTLNHAGGDVIDFEKAAVIVSPSAGFGSGYRTLYWEVPVQVKKLDAGESITIKAPVQSKKYDQGDAKKEDNAKYSAYGFDNAKNVGNYFTLKIEQNGKTVAETEVRIDP
ncbi:MAG TPA: type IV pilin N-terminal domain-containing protein [Methanocorpusculum sp.]|nr:type IV pilin N-terminal domain-containing protein [Methanocorpusculum sp.]